MYIYIDKTGTIKTQIDHGEPVRQGNSLRLYICFDENDPNVGLNSYMTVQCKVEDIHSKWSDLFTFSLKPELETFKKFKTSEMTYDLIDGKKYRVFQYGSNNGAIPCQEYTTLHFGKLECLLTLYDANGNKVLEDLAEINVSATYGKITPEVNLTRSNYEELMHEISLRVKANGGIAHNLTVTGVAIDNVSTSDIVKYILEENQEISIDDVSRYDYIQYGSEIYIYSSITDDLKTYYCINNKEKSFEIKSIIVSKNRSVPEKKIYNAYLNSDGEELSKKVLIQDTKITDNTNNIKGINIRLENEYVHLDNGKIPSNYLPGYVDDVLEVPGISVITEGEAGKIYVDVNTNKTYRWSGYRMVEISPSLALGETSSTAYAGNKGKQLADNVTEINSKLQNDYPHLINGKIPSDYLPSYVDDVIEVPGIALQETGEFGKIYVDVNTNKVYRWSGSRMIEIVGGGSGGSSITLEDVDNRIAEYLSSNYDNGDEGEF